MAKPASSRAALLVHLAEGLKTALEMGDTEAASVAHEAIGRLLGAEAKGAAVVDLGAARRGRGHR